MPHWMIAAPAAMMAMVAPGAATAGTPVTANRCIVLEQGDGSSPVISARVNGAGPFAFVLDTASSGTTLDDRRIRQLSLLPDGASEQAQGMGGAIEVHLFRLQFFESGPLSIRDLIVPGIPAPRFESHDIAGLAGVDLFGQHLAIWRWDRACVDLAASGDRPEGPGWQITPSRWLKPWKVMLPVRIGNVTGWGLLDTGAQKTVLSPGFARAIGLGGASANSGNTITGIDGQSTALALYEVPGATVGEWRFGPTMLSTAALPLFDRLGGMDEPIAVIGMDWIGRKPFAIDYGKQHVWQVR